MAGHRGRGFWAALLLGLPPAACGDGGTAPIEIPLGETTFVVVVNPAINDGTQAQLPIPGIPRSGVAVTLDQGPLSVTDLGGVAVLRPVPPGTRTLSFTSSGALTQLTAFIGDRDLRELAVAFTPQAAALMTEIRHEFGGEVVEIAPGMPVDEVNAELARSNLIVFVRGGTYSGDLHFSGSSVTLFGEGAQGGAVTLIGDVQVSGSRNRIRGGRIIGDLTVTGSDFGMSFSRVDGAVSIVGSGSVLLQNSLCGTVVVSGSGAALLGNTGLAPLPRSGC